MGGRLTRTIPTPVNDLRMYGPTTPMATTAVHSLSISDRTDRGLFGSRAGVGMRRPWVRRATTTPCFCT